MKVSITFDKNLKQTNKKQWVKEIQSVVDKLNNKAVFEQSPKTSPKHIKRNEQFDSYTTPKCSNDKDKIDAAVFKELISIQKSMQQKFDCLIGSISKLADKVNNVERRISVLQAKEVDRISQKEDFDRQFAQISLRYDKLRRASTSSQYSKQIMRETAASGFSYEHDLDKSN